MPYAIVPQGTEWCVFAEEGGQLAGEALGNHSTLEEAQEQITALRASERSAMPDGSGFTLSPSAGATTVTVALTDDGLVVKPTGGSPQPDNTIRRIGEDRVGGYGVTWGSPDERDMYGTYWTRQTYLGEAIDLSGEPTEIRITWYYDHGLSELPPSIVEHEDIRDYVMGEVVLARVDDVGVWIEAQRQRHDEWSEAVMQLIEDGELGWSLGTAPHLAFIEEDGWVKAWPVVEWSSTPSPAVNNTAIKTLRHLVDRGQTALERSDGPGGTGDGTVSNGTTIEQGGRIMPEINEATRAEWYRAYVATNWEQIEEAIGDVVRQEGGANLVAEALQPLADELAGIAGGTAEEALALLTMYVVEMAQGGPTEEEITEEPVMTDDAVYTVSEEQLQTLIQTAVDARLPEAPTGDALTERARSINVLGRAQPPMTLARHIRAVRDKDHAFMAQQRPAVLRGYRALGISPDTAGGYLVPVEQSNQIIELLRASAVVLPLCRQVPMNSWTMTIPSQTDGATAYWGDENAQLTASEQTFSQILLVAKKLSVLVKLSNELLDDSDPAVDALIRSDIARVAALKVDEAILRGSGVGSVPLGVLHSGATTTVLNAALTYAALSGCVSRVEVENVDEAPPWAWVFHPAVKDTLRQVEDTAGNLIWSASGDYQTSMATGSPSSLLGYPMHTTSNITRTGSPAESRGYFGQWNDVVVGQRKTLEIVASGEAGTSFEYDQTWIRAILRLDVALRHNEAMEVLTDIR